MLIYKFTLKRDRKSSVEIHYVRCGDANTAKRELAKHLGIDENIISFNPKNLPFKVREKVLNNVKEVIDGREVLYTLTLDFLNGKENKSDKTEEYKENLRKQITNEFQLVDSIYNTLKYNIQALYKEDEDVLSKFNNDRVYACQFMREQLLNNNLQDKEYNNNISLLEALDCYYAGLKNKR